ncbi:hypothetical protein [Streptomyces sp. NPDC057696]|uniref:hypothetical protein n=1 Tax=Streptomyces sp. NPDC057696 TaxID=3346218 RepID=UPI0036A4ECF5
MTGPVEPVPDSDRWARTTSAPLRPSSSAMAGARVVARIGEVLYEASTRGVVRRQAAARHGQDWRFAEAVAASSLLAGRRPA